MDLEAVSRTLQYHILEHKLANYPCETRLSARRCVPTIGLLSREKPKPDDETIFAEFAVES